MVPKASQRANGQQLAIHLLNAHDNERVEVADIRGAIACDLPGAFEEWHAVSRVTRCKKYLYSLSINPDPAQGALTRRQYKDYIARVEKKLGLSGQPRAIVFHIKEGREHCHVVWSRIIADQRKAVPISHDKLALLNVTREFAKDHSIVLTENMKPHAKTGDRPPPAPVSLHERQQQERTGVPKGDRMAEITRLWEETVSGKDFVRGLSQAGYRLARGDSVPYAVVDQYGEIHSLPRQVKGVRTKDIRVRLLDYPADLLPAASIVKAEVRREIAEALSSQFNRNADQSRDRLKQAQSRRRTSFRARLSDLKEQQQVERICLAQEQRFRLDELRADRLKQNVTGMMAILFAIPVISWLLTRRQRKEELSAIAGFRQERHELIIRQRLQLEDLVRQGRAIQRVEKREARSLETSLRREFLRARFEGSFQYTAQNHTDIMTGPHDPQINASHSDSAGETDEETPFSPPPLPLPVKKPPSKKPRKAALTSAFQPVTNLLPPTIRSDFQKAAANPSRKQFSSIHPSGPH
ncbi:MAG: hypothetical protein JSS38_11025 [Nitrospira sp.]|nr:hypothetical protein [Nitrospira sp.]